MTRQFKHGGRQRSRAEEALLFTAGDLDDLRRIWQMAVDQLQPDAATPPRLDDNGSDELGYPSKFGYGEKAAARDAILRQERAERIINERLGRPTLGYTPAPLNIAALEDLIRAETMLIGLADAVTRHIRRNTQDRRPGPHRTLPRHNTHVTVKHNDVDEYGYPLRLGYGRHAVDGRWRDHRGHTRTSLQAVGVRRDLDPALAAIAWLQRSLTAITDVKLAERTAGVVAHVRLITRRVVGLPDLQVRLEKPCFVCDQPALRMNLDKRYIECRNPDCRPTVEQCGFTGPRGEPRWHQGEWAWLSKLLNMSLEDRFLQLLEQAAAS